MCIHDFIISIVYLGLEDVANNQFTLFVSVENSSGIVQEQGRKAKQCHSVQRNIKRFPSKCDNVNENSIKCGKNSQIVCSKCKVTTYCSHYCQEKHWKTEHYASCDPVNN